jgi:Zn finger protein HypA/HybF involved in hydrogenase expression
MHDFYFAKEILDQVLLTAKEHHLKKVNRATIKLGEFIEHDEEILPANLKNNFQLLAKNTIAQGAELIIHKFAKNNHWELTEIDGDKKYF